MCILFIMVDLGKPERVTNVILHPTPNSILFWDMIVLNGYLAINLVVGWAALSAERKSVEPPKWIKPIIYLSVPWAVSIHTVTAFLYAGLPGRHFWLTAIMAPPLPGLGLCGRPGPAGDPGHDRQEGGQVRRGPRGLQHPGQDHHLRHHLERVLLRPGVFTAGYSSIPAHVQHLQYLFFGMTDHATGVWHGAYVPWMWTAYVLIAGGHSPAHRAQVAREPTPYSPSPA